MMLMMYSWLIIPVLLIGAVIFALGWRPNFDLSGLSQSKQTPLEILKARYAGGEITREEYEQARRDLEG
jgi:putative membrane protein